MVLFPSCSCHVYAGAPTLGTDPFFGRLIVHPTGRASRKHGPVPFRRPSYSLNYYRPAPVKQPSSATLAYLLLEMGSSPLSLWERGRG